MTTKYDEEGSLLWSKEYDYDDGRDYGAAITTDPDGYVYVAGASFDSSTLSFDMVVIKYDGDGVEEWAVRYDGPGEGLDLAVAIEVDGSGNVYVAGSRTNSGNKDLDYAVLKYNSSGTLQWSAFYDHHGLDDQAATMLLAPTGEVVVAGASEDSVSGWNYALVRYDASAGTLLQEKRSLLPAQLPDKPAALAGDAYGNFYLAGSIDSSGNDYDIHVMKLDDSLNVMWTASWDGDSYDDEPNAIGVDSKGNVYVTGYTADSIGKDFVTLRFDTIGRLEWVRTEQSSELTGRAEATDLQIDFQDLVYVTGWRSIKVQETEVYTVCYDSTGEKQWEHIPEEGNGEDINVNFGDVYVMGRTV